MAVGLDTFLQFYHQNVQVLDEFLHKKNKYTDVLALIEQKTSFKRVYIAQILIGIFCIYMIGGKFAALICNSVGFIYPAYASIKAIESSNKEDDTKWLTYWVVFAAFSVVEFFSDIILSWFFIYWLVKIVFLFWLFVPLKNNGSVVIYNRILKPFFLKNTSKVDNLVNQASNLLKKEETKFD